MQKSADQIEIYGLEYIEKIISVYVGKNGISKDKSNTREEETRNTY